jgi:hypothetical protein
MGAEDCMDAAERLLRLGLKGEQEREVTRVTVECCLQVGPCGWGGAAPARCASAARWRQRQAGARAKDTSRRVQRELVACLRRGRGWLAQICAAAAAAHLGPAARAGLGPCMPRQPGPRPSLDGFPSRTQHPPQEKAWNAYYAHLLLRLCGVGKGHKMTLQVRRRARRWGLLSSYFST